MVERILEQLRKATLHNPTGYGRGKAGAPIYDKGGKWVVEGHSVVREIFKTDERVSMPFIHPDGRAEYRDEPIQIHTRGSNFNAQFRINVTNLNQSLSNAGYKLGPKETSSDTTFWRHPINHSGKRVGTLTLYQGLPSEGWKKGTPNDLRLFLHPKHAEAITRAVFSDPKLIRTVKDRRGNKYK